MTSSILFPFAAGAHQPSTTNQHKPSRFTRYNKSSFPSFFFLVVRCKNLVFFFGEHYKIAFSKTRIKSHLFDSEQNNKNTFKEFSVYFIFFCAYMNFSLLGCCLCVGFPSYRVICCWGYIHVNDAHARLHPIFICLLGNYPNKK